MSRFVRSFELVPPDVRPNYLHFLFCCERGSLTCEHFRASLLADPSCSGCAFHPSKFLKYIAPNHDLYGDVSDVSYPHMVLVDLCGCMEGGKRRRGSWFVVRPVHGFSPHNKGMKLVPDLLQRALAATATGLR